MQDGSTPERISAFISPRISRIMPSSNAGRVLIGLMMLLALPTPTRAGVGPRLSRPSGA